MLAGNCYGEICHASRAASLKSDLYTGQLGPSLSIVAIVRHLPPSLVD